MRARSSAVTGMWYDRQHEEHPLQSQFWTTGSGRTGMVMGHRAEGEMRRHGEGERKPKARPPCYRFPGGMVHWSALHRMATSIRKISS